MGTNYFLETATFPYGNFPEDRLHIGKSSAGWCFSLHVDPELGIFDLDDWKNLFEFPKNRIVDEYGYPISTEYMLRIIENRSSSYSWEERNWYLYIDEADFHRKNQSERGPNNLLRHKSRYCYKQGAGTWDCILGAFR